jgi:hypothetical protein
MEELKAMAGSPAAGAFGEVDTASLSEMRPTRRIESAPFAPSVSPSCSWLSPSGKPKRENRNVRHPPR